jgi:hypothetical protein
MDNEARQKEFRRRRAISFALQKRAMAKRVVLQQRRAKIPAELLATVDKLADRGASFPDVECYAKHARKLIHEWKKL